MKKANKNKLSDFIIPCLLAAAVVIAASYLISRRKASST